MEDPEDCVVSESAADEELLEEPLSPPAAAPSQSSLDAEIEASSSPEALQERIVKLPKEVRNVVGGGLAGMAAKSVVAPLDRIKILYQVSSAEFRLLNVPNVARNIIKNEGLEALWKGNTATMIRVFPYSGIQFAIYDRCKSYFLREHEQEKGTGVAAGSNIRKWGLSPLESLLSGMLAGTVSVIFTYPLDLTRAQMAVVKRHRHAPNRGFVGVITDNYRQRGLAGLCRGMTPTLIGILPYSGIAFALNEQGKREVRCNVSRSACAWILVHG